MEREDNIKVLHVLARLPALTKSGLYFSNMIEEFKKYGHEHKAAFGIKKGINGMYCINSIIE